MNTPQDFLKISENSNTSGYALEKKEAQSADSLLLFPACASIEMF